LQQPASPLQSSLQLPLKLPFSAFQLPHQPLSASLQQAQKLPSFVFQQPPQPLFAFLKRVQQPQLPQPSFFYQFLPAP
jgi:hypothetical protein